MLQNDANVSNVVNVAMMKNVVENVARGCKMMQMLQNAANVEKCCKC